MLKTKKEELTEEIVKEDGEGENVRHVNNPSLDLPKIEKTYLKSVKGYVKEKDYYIFSDGKARVELKILTDEIFRVRVAPEGVFLDDFSYAVVELDEHPNTHEIYENEDFYDISTGTVTCRIQKADFRISFADHKGKVFNKDAEPMHWEDNLDFGGYYVCASKKVQQDEVFFGLGDKATGLNLRGKRFQNWNTDTYSYSFGQDPLYKSIPFYMGVTGGEAYGIFFDNSFRSFFDFASNNGNKTSFCAEGGEMRCYYIHGPKLLEVVRKFHQLTGTHNLPPLWALGYHQSRWSYYPEANVRATAEKFRRKQIPCDALYLDIDYMDGYRCFTWNKKFFPNPKKMTNDLAAMGFKTVAMIDPGIKVDRDYWVFREGHEKKYFCRRGDDYNMEGFVWPGRCQFPDYTKPEVREWWGGLYKGLVDDGIAGFWNDMNEPATFGGTKTFPPDVRHYYEGYRGSHRKAHNIYGMQMIRATYEGLKKLYKNKRPFTLFRAAYPGAQRYGATWTGDNIASWEHLRIALLQLQRLSVSGLSFCGSDIGGFTGNPDGELFTRWMQFGVFSPYMRVHSAGDTVDREPWSFGPGYEAVIKKFIELRYKLLSYIYSVFWEQYRYGLPILRPIAFLEQEIYKNLLRQDEFAFGAKILVAPVLNPAQRSRNVYLPKGLWYYYFSNIPYRGGKEINIATPLEEFPIFVKAGSVIPEDPVMQYTGEKRLTLMKYNVYYGVGEHHNYNYSDHGDTFAFEQDIYLERHFIYKGKKDLVTISQTREGLYTESYEKYKFYFIGLPFNPGSASVDGVETPVHREGNKFVVLVDNEFKKLIIR